MTFYNWLTRQKNRDDEIGDLANDATSDNNCPKGKKSQDYRNWCEFVTRRKRSKKGIKTAINNLDRAWYEYMYDYKKQNYNGT